MSQAQPKIAAKAVTVDPIAVASLTHVDDPTKDASYSSATLGGIHLDVISNIISFLELTDIVHATAINRKFRFEVAGHQPKITIASFHQVKQGASISKTFPNLAEIEFEMYGGSLLHTPGFASHIVPFLAQFPKLTNASFLDVPVSRLGITLQMPEEEGEEFDPVEAAIPIIILYYKIADGYSFGDIPDTLKINELFCPVLHPSESPCPLCNKALETFSMEHLLLYPKTAFKGFVVTFDQGPSLLLKKRPLHERVCYIHVSRFPYLSPEKNSFVHTW